MDWNEIFHTKFNVFTHKKKKIKCDIFSVEVSIGDHTLRHAHNIAWLESSANYTNNNLVICTQQMLLTLFLSSV